jgi:hypothetical protein
MKNCRSIAAAVLILSVLLLTPANIFSCGPFFTEAIFVSKVRPAPSIDRYLATHLGVVLPTYYRVYLAIAYRVLSGKPIDQSQIAKAKKYWSYDQVVNQDDDSALRQWEAARTAALSDNPKSPRGESQRPTSIDLARRTTDSFSWYMNCTPDAFHNAAFTLEDRAHRFGHASATIRDWVEAQDAVFSNCAADGLMPSAAPANADPLMKADRSYQVAAAHFYRGEFGDARTGFLQIAEDHTSPWRTIAPYLAARTLIRQATLTAPEGKPSDPTLLAQAETELEAILADNNAAQIHPAVEHTLGFVQFRLQPDERMHVLALRVAGEKKSPDLGQDLIDYTKLLEQTSNRPAPEASGQKAAHWTAASDDITDWILTAQSPEPEARQHAVQRWRQTHAASWLVAALGKTDEGDTDLDTLLEAAAVLPENSPAHDSAVYNRARLMLATGLNQEARTLLDTELQRVPQPPNQTRNLYLGLRWQLALNFDEFVKFAPQVPVAYDVGYDSVGSILGSYCHGDNCAAAPEQEQAKKTALLDKDVAAKLNQRTPLALLTKAAQSRLLPANLRQALLVSTWSRAAILGHSAGALELGHRLGPDIPLAAKYLSEYDASPDESSREFAAVFTMMHFPGMRPYVTAGVLRETPLAKIDNYRDNWWGEDVGGHVGRQNFANGCGAWSTWREGNVAAEQSAPTLTPESPSFLSPTERTAADGEWQRLRQIGPAPNYFGQVVLAWAKAHSDDPRVPEALHLVVRSSRYGCNNRETSRFSREAFELLHRQFGKSEWATKTPHWFE